jgi:hypothetical protein
LAGDTIENSSAQSAAAADRTISTTTVRVPIKFPCPLTTRRLFAGIFAPGEDRADCMGARTHRVAVDLKVAIEFARIGATDTIDAISSRPRIWARGPSIPSNATLVPSIAPLVAPPRFSLAVADEAKDYVLHEGADVRYGARHLKRAIERLVAHPVSNLIATGNWRATTASASNSTPPAAG